jgi:hypothetical protein
MVRDLTKSMLSFSWAMSLFGVEQLANTLMPQKPSQPTHRATAAFNAVTQATEEQMGSALRGAFKAGDQLQRGMVDLMFGFLSLEAFNPSQMMRMTSDTMRRTTEAFGQSSQRGSSQPPAGWGPMPSTSPSRPQPQTAWEPMPTPRASQSQPQTGWGPMSSPGPSRPQSQAGWGP